MLSAPLVRDGPPEGERAARVRLEESKVGSGVDGAGGEWMDGKSCSSCGPVVVLRQSARCRPTVRGQHGVTPFVQEPLVRERTGHDRCWIVMCARTVQYSICHTFTWLYYQVTLTVVSGV
jgi:hypothetical protein